MGGNGKAEDTKLPGAGIPPKPCPMERVKMETMYEMDRTSALGDGKHNPHGRHSSHRRLVDYGRGTRRGTAASWLPLGGRQTKEENAVSRAEDVGKGNDEVHGGKKTDRFRTASWTYD